ncbi:MAG: hypothetical protein WA666_11955 [Nitrospirota bacterium]
MNSGFTASTNPRVMNSGIDYAEKKETGVETGKIILTAAIIFTFAGVSMNFSDVTPAKEAQVRNIIPIADDLRFSFSETRPEKSAIILVDRTINGDMKKMEDAIKAAAELGRYSKIFYTIALVGIIVSLFVLPSFAFVFLFSALAGLGLNLTQKIAEREIMRYHK